MATIEKTTPRGGKWKNRFFRKGGGGKDAEESSFRSYSTSNSAPTTNTSSMKKKVSVGLVRKLKTINRSFRKEQRPSTVGKNQDHLPSSLNISSKKKKNQEEADDASPSNPQSPYSINSCVSAESDININEKQKKDHFDFPGKGAHQEEERQRREIIYQKQHIKERDGFCRRVDTYDGSVIVVDQKPTYEIGNYLGGGVAGVVYEGHRLRPMNEYPVRLGLFGEQQEEYYEDEENNPNNANKKGGVDANAPTSPEVEGVGFFCAPVEFVQTTGEGACGGVDVDEEEAETGTVGSPSSITAVNINNNNKVKQTLLAMTHEEVDMAIEATVSHNEHGVMLDAQDAPSRSKHYTKAASVKLNPGGGRNSKTQQNKSLQHGLTEDSVAIKILNPVGYRILQTEGLKGSVVVKEGQLMDIDVKKGLKPMQEKHVSWLVNPNSRNLRTLKRYSGKNDSVGSSKGIQVDRGTASKGLRLSLIAAYIDPRTNKIRELTLTRCIEIWGHIPFNATDVEFEDMMTAIERVNAGQPPPPVPAFIRDYDHPPPRVGTDVTGTNSTTSHSDDMHLPIALKTARTGLLRAALAHRQTVFCDDLNAFIAIPAVPSKYLRWLRQRRAATKEIRNMMSIGRHKNVLHLFEVLEFIQDSKSTMFLILELVKGGELFDLISSNAGSKGRKSQGGTEESEKMMRRFFFELASGIHFCHKNGIAHRDLKPENLLVHTSLNGQPILKIADFGLSAAFGSNGKTQMSDNDTLIDSLASPTSQTSVGGDGSYSPSHGGGLSPSSQASGASMKDSMDKFIASGASALSFLTCGAMENVLCIPTGDANDPSPLRRMTSVVGSPHYVAPEIISQTDDSKSKRNKNTRGYDGAKADVWSAGVILYAMLFRSLPFGEDLLRCPRYQSYKKWYDDIREAGGRRSSAGAALNPYISDSDERDYLGPHWFFPATTSKESRDLIVAMLNPKPEDRLSVGQVLDHLWVAAEK